MEYAQAIKNVIEQSQFEYDRRGTGVSMDVGIQRVTRSLLDLRHEAFLPAKKRDADRITAKAIELAALTILLISD